MTQVETEIKLIIKRPDILKIRAQSDFTESRITQIYLSSDSCTHRIRKRVYSDGKTVFQENTKVRISPMSSIENEREIGEDEFLELAKNIEQGTLPLMKTRRTFEYCGKTVELDFYDAWEKTCILEIELGAENEKVTLPEFIEVMKDVTGNKSYSNHTMARKFPEEII